MGSNKQLTRRQMKMGLYKLTLARSDFFASRKACAYMVSMSLGSITRFTITCTHPPLFRTQSPS